MGRHTEPPPPPDERVDELRRRRSALRRVLLESVPLDCDAYRRHEDRLTAMRDRHFASYSERLEATVELYERSVRELGGGV